MAGQRFIGLDGLRGVAALTVVIGHANNVFYNGGQLDHYFAAVDVFFVLSGFVIALNYDNRLKQGFTFTSFLKARARRLLPTFWIGMTICTAIFFGYLFTQPHLPPQTPALVVSAIALFALIPTFALGNGLHAFPIAPVTWSLFHEWLVNILYAGFAYRLSMVRLIAVSAAGYLGAILSCALTYHPYGLNSGGVGLAFFVDAPLRAIGGFTLGVIFFRWHRMPSFQRLPSISPEVMLVGWFALAAVPCWNPHWLTDGLVMVAGCPLIVLLLIRSDRPAPRFCSFLGEISYPLYVSHFNIVGLAHVTSIFGGTNIHPNLLGGLQMLATCIAVACLVGRLVTNLPTSSVRSRATIRAA